MYKFTNRDSLNENELTSEINYSKHEMWLKHIPEKSRKHEYIQFIDQNRHISS